MLRPTAEMVVNTIEWVIADYRERTNFTEALDHHDWPTIKLLPLPTPTSGGPMPHVIAVANIKGGVGKTTTALNIAYSISAGGYGDEVLLLDLDPQAACAYSLGVDADELPATVHDVLVDEHTPLEEIILPTSFGHLAPSNITLAEAELTLASVPLREYVLKRKLEAVADRYAYIVIDTPPQLGLLTINAFAAADYVLIPVSTQFLSLRGLDALLGTIDKLKRYGVNDRLQVMGIVPTKYDRRTVHSREVLAFLERFCAERNLRLFDPIPHTVKFDDAANERRPFVDVYYDHEAAHAYEKLAREIVDVAITQAA